MQSNQTQLYEEITSVLKADLTCAESLHATGCEIQSLLELGQYDLVQERCHSRGEILNLMVSLDGKLAHMFAEAKRLLSETQWQTLIGAGKRLHDLMLSITSLDHTNQTSIEKRCEEIRQALNQLADGRRKVKQYTQVQEPVKTNCYQA